MQLGREDVEELGDAGVEESTESNVMLDYRGIGAPQVWTMEVSCVRRGLNAEYRTRIAGKRRMKNKRAEKSKRVRTFLATKS